jgi:DNA-binding MarR family transcriptional regulator
MARNQTEITELIARISARLRQTMTTAMDNVALGGLTPQQARVLGFIEANEAKGTIQRDIADVTGTRAANVSSLLQVLERDGWVERRADPNDARRKTLHVTPKGRAQVKRFEAGIWASATVKLDTFTDAELDEFRRLLTKLDQELAD